MSKEYKMMKKMDTRCSLLDDAISSFKAIFLKAQEERWEETRHELKRLKEIPGELEEEGFITLSDREDIEDDLESVERAIREKDMMMLIIYTFYAISDMALSVIELARPRRICASEI